MRFLGLQDVAKEKWNGAEKSGERVLLEWVLWHEEWRLHMCHPLSSLDNNNQDGQEQGASFRKSKNSA